MATSIGDLALKLSMSPAGLVTGLSTAEKKVSSFGAVVDKQMDATNKAISRLGNTAPKMAGLDAAKTKLEGMGKVAAKGMGEGFGSLGTLAAGAGLGRFGSLLTDPTIAMAGLASASILVGAGFEKSMSRVKALSGAMGGELAGLRDLALDLGKAQFSPTDVAQAMGEFSQAGFSVNEIMGAMRPMLDAASAGEIGLAESVDITARAIRGFGLDASKTQELIDGMVHAAIASNMTFKDMGEAIKFVSPVATAAGVSWKETAAALMVLADSGLRAEMGGTALRGILMKLSNPTDEAKALMKSLGVSFVDTAGEMRPIADIIDDLQAKLGKFGKGDQVQIVGTLFETRSATGTLAMINQGGNAIREKLKGIDSSLGTTARVAATKLDNVAGSWQKMQASMSTAGIRVFDTIRVPLKSVVDAITTGITGIGAGILRVGEILSPLVTGIRSIASAFAGPIEFMGKVVVGVGAIKLAVVGLTAAVGGLALAGRAAMTGLAFFMKPVTLAVAGVVGLTEMTVGLDNAMKSIDSFVSHSVEGLGFFASKMGEGFTAAGNKIKEFYEGNKELIDTSASTTFGGAGIGAALLRGVGKRPELPQNSFDDLLRDQRPLAQTFDVFPKLRESVGKSPNLSKIIDPALTLGDALKRMPGLAGVDPSDFGLDGAQTLREALESTPLLREALGAMPDLTPLIDQSITLGRVLQDMPDIANVLGVGGKVSLDGLWGKITPGGLMKSFGMTFEEPLKKAKTVAVDLQKWMDRDALLTELPDALNKQLASAKESLDSTRGLSLEANVLERAWHGVTLSTKEFGGQLEKLKRLGATDEQTKPIKAMQDQVRQTMLSEKLFAERAKLFADTRTPFEQLRSQFSDITALFDKGTIDADLFGRSLFRLTDGLNMATDAKGNWNAGAAAIKGSAEAISITNRFRSEDSKGTGNVVADAIEKVRKLQEADAQVNKEKLAEAKKLRDELTKLLKGDKLAK